MPAGQHTGPKPSGTPWPLPAQQNLLVACSNRAPGRFRVDWPPGGKGLEQAGPRENAPARVPLTGAAHKSCCEAAQPNRPLLAVPEFGRRFQVIRPPRSIPRSTLPPAECPRRGHSVHRPIRFDVLRDRKGCRSYALDARRVP